MFKNVASQKLSVYAYDATTGLPKTGDAANITAYVSKDDGSVTQLGDTSATEQDSTNAKGYYLFDLTQAETNADKLTFSAKSSTSNIVVLAVPSVVYTRPANFTKTVIDSAGLVDANAVKVGPSGSGTAQTARDIGAGVNVSQFGGANGTFASGRPEVNVTHTAGQSYASAAIATDGGNSATTFKTTLTQSADDFWIDAWLLITSGTLAGEVKLVTDYNGTSKTVTVAGGFTGTPADGVTFVLINR